MGAGAGVAVTSEPAPGGGPRGRRLVMAVAVAAAAVIPGVVASVSAAGAAPALYAQTDFPGPFGVHSDTTYFDARAADDFVVPAGVQWALTEVDPTGVAGACGTVGTVDVTIYGDAAGLPGSVVYSATVTTAGGLTQDVCALAVPVDVTLDPGHYWLSVQSVGASWGWQVRSTVSNDEAVWVMPPPGYFTDCNSWCGMDTALGTSSTWDLDFSLQGTVVDPAPDLSLGDTAPAGVVSGDQYSYSLVATNTGGETAGSVSVVDSLPGTVHFDSVSTTAGSCVRSAPPNPPRTKGGTVSCDLGSLAAGSSATVTVVVTATTPGTVVDDAGLTATGVTPDGDDGAGAATVVQGG